MHNIPLVRYLLLRGRCVNCYKKIQTYYILVEFLSAVRFDCDSLSNYLVFASCSLIYMAINRTFLLIFTSNSYRIASPYPHCGLDFFKVCSQFLRHLITPSSALY
ncbi:prepilin peptidase [Coxiella-like endosymbiont of Rhipicephalus sanguineus]|uniref:prepilin peptidase n=1 Tax=Coxiella-like endosymbiont of Rhipicephalus sanguineus TaxID=1955402 RepID=UPI00203C0D84|nr:prepilin peptidase [Coxiella-like endosymbiont of Rhipicephalus sanguineus]